MIDPQPFIDALTALHDADDVEMAALLAEDLIARYLRLCGQNDLVNAWEAVPDP